MSFDHDGFFDVFLAFQRILYGSVIAWLKLAQNNIFSCGEHTVGNFGSFYFPVIVFYLYSTFAVECGLVFVNNLTNNGDCGIRAKSVTLIDKFALLEQSERTLSIFLVGDLMICYKITFDSQDFNIILWQNIQLNCRRILIYNLLNNILIGIQHSI